MQDTSSPALHVTDQFHVNTIVWIRSLPDDEIGPSQRMVEDIEALALKGGDLKFEEVNISTSMEMIAALSTIALRCASGLRPILHFDCHGSEKHGLLLAPSGDHLGWTKLANALREINTAAENNICCIFGVCFGMHLSTELSVSQPTPYFMIIAPEREIAVGVLESRFPPFYAQLFETGSITQAHHDALAPDLTASRCTELFAKVLATYIINHASGAGVSLRKESLLTRLFAACGIAAPSRDQLRQAREQMKAALKPTQELVDRFAGIFLIGREPGFGLEEVRQLVEGMRRRREAEQNWARKAKKARRLQR